MLLGFKKRFVMPIKIGTKVHTMRKKPKREPKIGETLYMYTGLRTTHCEFITDKETLISKQKVRVVINRKPIDKMRLIHAYSMQLKIDGRELKGQDLDRFVRFDGFENVTDFCKFWFIGEKKTTRKVGGIMTLYHWTDLRY